jgi:NAD(P)-dependent dehydrogenase (short-subunit alcohol dehydrogenase family)
VAAPGRLFDVRAVVFGAAGGIGEAIARVYGKHGAKVLAVDGVNSDVGRQLKSVPGVSGLSLALHDAGTAAMAVETAVREFGGLDVLVNSFALQPAEPFGDESSLQGPLSQRLERLRHHFDIALPHLRNSPSGRVISVGYLRSAFKRDGAALSASAEDALAEQTRALAAISGQHGITVNYLQPGAVMTAESRRIFAADSSFRDYCIRGSAARRIGDPIDIAKVAMFLASDDAAFVSGSGVRVDGGRIR